MMGTKCRSFTPLPNDVSLEDLVSEDPFYRRLVCIVSLALQDSHLGAVTPLLT